MKRRFFLSCIILLFGVMLVFPKPVFTGAQSGILLWFHTVLPTLLPFMILSNLLVATPAASLISRVTGPLFCRLFKVSDYGSFAVLTGFLCGYPMGSKVVADLLRSGRISMEEGNYLLSFCNNTSPMFLISYVIWQNLRAEHSMLPAVVIVTASPVICSFLFRRFYFRNNRHFSSGRPIPEQSTAPGRIAATVVDDCIMDGFVTITKVGGYIMLFSILISLAEMLPFHHPFLSLVILPSLEITNGIPLICSACKSAAGCLILVFSLTAFGGWCSVAQTQCMIQGTGLKIVPYIIEKLVTAAVASLLTVCFILLRQNFF